MKTLGQFIADRRKELGLSGREVVAGVKKADGTSISIPFLVDLEHDRRKPGDEVLEGLAKVLQVDSDILYFLAGRMPRDLHTRSLKEDDLTAAFRAFRREVKREKKP
ncbi:MAG TPA: helix-turn-helix transcriptional regulator [Candidatus Binataceae bacterium]|nr:helix-turn-helix transcriptional regulator [Candidatus Binataceae bacterium]